MAAMLALGASVLACGRSASTDSTKNFFPTAGESKSAGAAGVAWQVKCDHFCGVHAKAASLDALCEATAAAAQVKSTCTARRAVGFPQIPASAVSDAAIVELSTNKVERTAFLALKTVKGWQIARPLGTGTSIKTISASPVDVPGLAPAAVQLQVALGDESSSHERLFVCGLTGEGTTSCPIAIEVAGTKVSSDFSQMAAHAGGAMDGWRVTVEVTPKGYVAKKVTGSVPDGLAGEHGFDVAK